MLTPSVFEAYGGSNKSKREDRFIMPRKLELYRAGKTYIDKEGIRQFLSTLSYPLYFLDFETMQNSIPQYDGAKPYQQITFQYSLHIKRDETSPYEHKEFLAESDIILTIVCRMVVTR